MVFEEIVEGNITRLVGVFHSPQPGRVGPVRSARTTDVQLLPQLGRPLLAWSGGNAGVVAAVRSSPSIIDAGVDVATGSYSRQGPHPAPHNLYVEADQLWQVAPAGTAFSRRASRRRRPRSAAAFSASRGTSSSATRKARTTSGAVLRVVPSTTQRTSTSVSSRPR